MSQTYSKKIWAYLAWLSISIIWGTTFLAIKVGVEQLPPLLFAGFRWLIAGAIFFVILRVIGMPLPSRKDLVYLAIIGTAMLGFSNGLIVAAEQWIPSGLTALMITTLPLWTTVTESMLPGAEKNNRTVYLGLGLGFAGMLLIFSGNIDIQLKGNQLLGILFVFLSIVSWIFGTLFSKYRESKVHPMMGAAIQMLIAGSLQTLLGLGLGELSRFQFDQNSLLAFLYLIFVASMLGYGSYMYAISKLPVSFVMTHAYINPIIALFLGWLVLDEVITVEVIVATAIILIAVILVRRGNRKKMESDR